MTFSYETCGIAQIIGLQFVKFVHKLSENLRCMKIPALERYILFCRSYMT